MPKPETRKSTAAAPLWDTEHILPGGFAPMLPASAAGPLDSHDFAYELRWDGLRVLCGLELQDIIISTGAAGDILRWFPELRSLRDSAEPDWVLLDGEIVVFDGVRPSQERLQQRLRAGTPETIDALARQYPATLILSDILRIGDSWLMDVNWDERRDILGRAVRQREPIRLSPVYREGRHALDLAREIGLDSVLAKRLKGRYVPGERTREWLTMRPLEILHAVITGWLPGKSGRAADIGSVMLGMYRGDELTYVGYTLAAIDPESQVLLWPELRAREQSVCPCHDVPAVAGAPRWVFPDLVCRVKYHGWTAANRLRSPAFVDLDPAVLPSECRAATRAAVRARRS